MSDVPSVSSRPNEQFVRRQLRHRGDCAVWEYSGAECDCTGGLKLAYELAAALRLVCGDLQDVHARFTDNRAADYEPPDDFDVERLMEETISRVRIEQA